MNGLYVDFWRYPGLHSVEEMQALNAYCIDSGITDLFVHYKKDKATNKITYFLERSGFYYLDEVKKNITVNLHLWLPVLLLFRKKNAIPIQDGLVTMEFNNKVYLDPVDEFTRDYIVDYITSFDFDRLHLDRLWYPMMSDIGTGSRADKINALTDIVRRVRERKPTAYISVPIITHGLFNFGETTFGLNDFRGWKDAGYIDLIVPIILGATAKNLDVYLELSRPFTDTFAVYADNTEALEKTKNENVIEFSYGTANI